MSKTLYLNDQELEMIIAALIYYESDCMGDYDENESSLFDIANITSKLMGNKIKRIKGE